MKDLGRLVEHSDILLSDADRVEEIYEQRSEDVRQAARGNVRTACERCDGEFYVSKNEKGRRRLCGGC